MAEDDVSADETMRAAPPAPGAASGPTGRGAVRRDPWLGLILVVAFLFRLGYGFVLGLGAPPEARPFLIDEQEYYAAAQMLAAGHGFAFYDTFAWTRAPLYPLLVAAVFRVAGVTPGLVPAVQAVLSTSTLYWLATLAGRTAADGALLSTRAARRIAALVGACWLPFTLFSQLLVSETLFLSLFVAALVVLARWADGHSLPGRPARESWLLLGGAGALLGLAALTRSTALAFLPLAAGWVAWRRGSLLGGWGLVRRPSPPAPPPSPLTPLPDRERGTKLEDRAGASTGVGAESPSPRRWGEGSGVRGGVRAALVLLAGAALVIAPWTARNIAAYGITPGGPVIIDTSSGYNLWLAANGVRDGERLAKELQGIDGVLVRQQHALAQAQEQLAADPGAFLAKGQKEAGDLWTINFTAEERQVRGYTAGRVPAAHLLALALLEDGLYLLLVPLALLGLAVAPPDPLKALLGLWAGLWVVMAFVFFAVTRFRFPVVACLLPWAPLGLAWLVGRGWRTLPVRGGRWALIGLAGLFLLGVGPSAAAAAGDAALGVARWGEQAPFRAGEHFLPNENAAQARAALELYAAANQEIADTRFSTLAAQIIAAESDAALEMIRRSPYLDTGSTGSYNTRVEPYILLGQIARLRDDPAEAARLFTNRAVNDATPEALIWARTHLGRLDQFGSQIDVGSGLDVGFVQGMYSVEREDRVTYRWTGPEAVVVARPYTGMTMLVNGWRPPGWPSARLRFRFEYAAHELGTQEREVVVPNDTDWHEVRFDDLNAGYPGLLRVVLTTNTFVPGGFDPRTLGVRIDVVEWK